LLADPEELRYLYETDGGVSGHALLYIRFPIVPGGVVEDYVCPDLIRR
jgi:hypothetical protein